MEALTDDDLFVYMAFYESAADRPTAEAAYRELCRRYTAELLGRCEGMCRRYKLADHDASELVALTMSRALSRAETYKGPGSRGRTMAWLCTIARNAIRDAKRNPSRPSLVNAASKPELGAENYSVEDFAGLYHELKSPLTTQQHWAAVTAAFERLDERTQRVLLETLLQRTKSPAHSYMYRGTAAELAALLGVTTDNLRRIRCDGMKAIARELALMSQSKGGRHADA